MPTVLHSLLVGGIDYSQDTIAMCGKAKMARSVTVGWTYDEGISERSVTGE